MKKRIHIFGAAGSGTTTIAKAICDKTGYRHFDSDDYFWLPTKDPFTVERQREECLNLMSNDLSNSEKWVLSGSLSGWGELLIPFFDLVIFVYVPEAIRLERLRKREYERYGEDILPGGVRHKATKAFLEWAATYDAGTRNGRSLPKHEKLLQEISCPIVKIVNHDLDESIKTVFEAIRQYRSV